MRLFTAIDLPPDIASRLEGILMTLRPASSVRWSRVANLHITTKFIGQWPEERLQELKRALAGVPTTGEIEIGLRGLGWFPNPHHPRVFWIGVQAPEALRRLAEATQEAAAQLGIPREDRAYHPHLTLARLDAGKDPPGAAAALRAAAAELDDSDCGAFTARDWSLYLSQPGPDGSRYTKLETFSLL
jgi:2'-5' RNA ligase